MCDGCVFQVVFEALEEIGPATAVRIGEHLDLNLVSVEEGLHLLELDGAVEAGRFGQGEPIWRTKAAISRQAAANG